MNVAYDPNGFGGQGTTDGPASRRSRGPREGSQRSSIGLSTSPFWYASRAASVRFETPSFR